MSERDAMNDRLRAAASVVVASWMVGDFGRIFPPGQAVLRELHEALVANKPQPPEGRRGLTGEPKP